MSDHYLQVGEVLMWGGTEHRVTRVGDCNATIKAVTGKVSEVWDIKTSSTKRFVQPPKELLISNVTSSELMVKA